MKNTASKELDFEIDALTSSIQNILTGEVFETQIHKLERSGSIKKSDWLFDWKTEFKNVDNEIFKLTTVNNPAIIHGLISQADKGDHIFMNLIESAKFNKGSGKIYQGVAGNLVAFSCKISFERNYDGVISFIAKTQLIDHYEKTLGATLFGKNRMFIDTKQSLALVKKYFKDFSYDKH